MSDEEEIRQEVGDFDEIREDESGGEEEMDEDGGSDSSEGNEESEVEGMDEDDESDSSAENEVSEVEESGEGEESYPVQNAGESVSVSSPNKRIKLDSIDLLSALPDCLLVRILARLDMKKAVTTCVLSKRWQYLWTQLPSLSFSESSSKIEKTRRLVSWVHRTLVLRSVNYLDRLHISFTYNECFASDINTWVEFAVRNKVKELRLELHLSPYFFDMLPQSMYSCSSLTSLSMKRCVVAPLTTVDWKYLTQLTIEDVELQEHAIQKILSGCPVLSSLDLTDCWGFDRLEVNSQSLRELGVSDCDDEITGPLLEISAPYIRSLRISPFPIVKRELRLTNIPSVIKANIHFEMGDWNDITEMGMDNTMNFFEDIKHVKELELNCQCLEVLSKLAEDGWQLPISTRERLIVDSFRDEKTIYAVLFLLETSPNLETLDVHCYDEYQVSDVGKNVFGNLLFQFMFNLTGLGVQLRGMIWIGDLLRLKTVHLMDCADPNLDGEPMLNNGPNFAQEGYGIGKDGC
ncbi:F-box/LRR-repeat protein at5g02910 [Phtheirospermum japonicum]|uniref:F-box/LRR-repeat protein at5g02910 n=1 Tax=Phtheirospermum japonicum TaxID=374723 RepID=A0A830B767_9LAMI|nr:F-box/LRR-repeat protein at5g02910 [Phtheirospermum japonicum]